MIISDNLVQAAADAFTAKGLHDWLRHTDQQDVNREWAELALTAAFAALPIDQIKDQVLDAVMEAFLPSLPRQIEAKIAANAASDVWLATLGIQREST